MCKMKAFCPDCGLELKNDVKICPGCGFDINSDSDPSVEILDNRYKIISVIGKGGMGAVYKAEHVKIGKIVAIKEMNDDHFRTDKEKEDARKRFEKEARILCNLSHQGLPQVSDFFTIEETYNITPANTKTNTKAVQLKKNRYFLVMSYVEGKDLKMIMKERGSKPVSEDQVLKWLDQVIDILNYLHTQNPPVIYRDIKPSNIMVTDDDKVTLIDFGIAKIFENTSKGTLIGTPGYSPPEQYKGISDQKSDIYSLGATLHYLLTGIDPETDQSNVFHFKKISEVNSISSKLENVIESMLEQDPSKRPNCVMDINRILSIISQPQKTNKNKPKSIPSRTPIALIPHHLQRSSNSFNLKETPFILYVIISVLTVIVFMNISKQKKVQPSKPIVITSKKEANYNSPVKAGSEITKIEFINSYNSFSSIDKIPGDLDLVKEIPGLENGEGAIRYSYENKPSDYSGIGTLSADLNNFTEIKVRIRSEKKRIFAIAIFEIEKGSIYVRIFEVESDKWTVVKAVPSEFILSSGSTDSNDKLDIAKLDTKLFVADMSGFKGITGPNIFWVSEIDITK